MAAIALVVAAGTGVAVEFAHFGILQPHRPDDDPRATAAWIIGHRLPRDGVFYEDLFVGESVRWYLVDRGPVGPPLDVMLRDDMTAADTGRRTPPPRGPESARAAFASVHHLFVVLADPSEPKMSREHERILAEVQSCGCWSPDRRHVRRTTLESARERLRVRRAPSVA